jgi:hypothetical protein
MTSFSGHYINGAVCCGARYSTRRYRSMNFMSSALWTDGYREHSLMPNDHGLRRCKCGNYFLQSELVTISEVDETDEPLAPRVPPEDLPAAIAQARTHAVELAARLDYWQHLNHAYRDLYRVHREAEDAATKAAWEAANPDRRALWQSFLKMDRKPPYQPALDRAITFPVFKVSREQHENISALLRLQKITGSDLWIEPLTVAELYRELGKFDEAERALALMADQDDRPTGPLMWGLIQQRINAPIRYRPSGAGADTSKY